MPSYCAGVTWLAGPAGGAEEPLLHQKIGAALVTSAIGITVANPSDVVKVRQQACTVRGDGIGASHIPFFFLDSLQCSQTTLLHPTVARKAGNLVCFWREIPFIETT